MSQFCGKGQPSHKGQFPEPIAWAGSSDYRQPRKHERLDRANPQKAGARFRL